MKFLLFIALVSNVSSFGLADAMPAQWLLPNKGANCVLQNRFSDGVTCGSKRYEVWNCPSTTVTSGFKSYLLVGKYKSDTANSCSPTYVIEKVLEQ